MIVYNIACYTYVLFWLTASEVFEMNHEATRLTEQLTVLRKNSQLYRDSLEQYREEGLGNKEEQEEKLRHLNEAVATVQSELEVS